MQRDDTRPIWSQLVDDLRRRVVSGEWPPGSRIPSVRELAAQAGVNPNTVQRALTELDRTGLTVTERTAGRFVTSDPQALEQARRELAQQATDTYLATAAGLGLTQDQVTELVASRWPTINP